MAALKIYHRAVEILDSSPCPHTQSGQSRKKKNSLVPLFFREEQQQQKPDPALKKRAGTHNLLKIKLFFSRYPVTWATTSWIPVTVQSHVRVHQWDQWPLKKKYLTEPEMLMEWTELRSRYRNEESYPKTTFLWCRASLTYLGGMLAFKYSSMWLTSAGRNIFFSVNRKGTLQASTTRRRTPALRKVKSVPLTWECKNISCCHLISENP